MCFIPLPQNAQLKSSQSGQFYDTTQSCDLCRLRYYFLSIRSGPAKVGSGNLVWRSQGAWDAEGIFPRRNRCADNWVRTEFLRRLSAGRGRSPDPDAVTENQKLHQNDLSRYPRSCRRTCCAPIIGEHERWRTNHWRTNHRRTDHRHACHADEP